MNRLIVPVGVVWVLVSIAIGISVLRSPASQTVSQTPPVIVSDPSNSPPAKQPSANSALEAKVTIKNPSATELKLDVK